MYFLVFRIFLLCIITQCFAMESIILYFFPRQRYCMVLLAHFDALPMLLHRAAANRWPATWYFAPFLKPSRSIKYIKTCKHNLTDINNAACLIPRLEIIGAVKTQANLGNKCVKIFEWNKNLFTLIPFQEDWKGWDNSCVHLKE